MSIWNKNKKRLDNRKKNKKILKIKNLFLKKKFSYALAITYAS